MSNCDEICRPGQDRSKQWNRLEKLREDMATMQSRVAVMESSIEHLTNLLTSHMDREEKDRKWLFGMMVAIAGLIVPILVKMP